MIDDSREKLINMMIFFLKKTKHCGKTKLFKLLSFADFEHYRQTGKSISGLIYSAFPWGPVSKELFAEMENPPKDLNSSMYIPSKKELDNDEEYFRLMPKKRFEDKYFTDREIEILEKIVCMYKEALSKDISKISHDRELPWHKTVKEKGMWQEIDYSLSLNESSPSKEVIAAAQEERDELKSMLSI